MATSPNWTVLNPGSFASIRITLPPNTSVNCETDAVVSMSQGVSVRGVLSGGFFSGLARALLTNESFLTTKVEYQPDLGSNERVGEVLLAPSDPGGIVLHSLEGRMGDDLLLTAGAYVASDDGVRVTTEVQSRLGNSILSGTGFFLLRASGRGCLACSAYGSVHKYILRVGETRAVDNGHLVAWTASMPYTVKLGGKRGGFISSVSSGEGLMCFFEGPGIIFVQSHKPNVVDGTATQPRGRNSAGGICSFVIFVYIAVLMFVLFLVLPIYLTYMGGDNDNSYQSNSGRQNGQYGQYGGQMPRGQRIYGEM